MSKVIENKILRNKEKIVKLLNENIDLKYNLNLKKFLHFSEETINVGTKKVPSMVKVKMAHWKEFFIDEDTPKNPISIERKNIIEVEGKKSYGWEKIKYYFVEDL